MQRLAIVIPFPLHRVRRRTPRRNQVFAALFDEVEREQAELRLLLACATFVAFVSVVLELVVG